MDEPNNDETNATTNLTIETSPRALAEINYNSVIAPDRNTSSDDEGPEATEIQEKMHIQPLVSVSAGSRRG